MRQTSSIPRVMRFVAAFFLFMLTLNGARAQEIVLQSYGPALENEAVQKALVHAVDWQSLTSNIFDDPYIPVILYGPGQGAPLDNYILEFDPSVAEDLLYGTEDYGEGFPLALLYIHSADMAQLAGEVADSLWKLGIEVTLYEASDMKDFAEAEAYLQNQKTNSLVLWTSN